MTSTPTNASPDVLDALKELCDRLGPRWFLEQNWSAPLAAIAKAEARPTREEILARAASVICEAACGLYPQCKSREAAQALLDAGLLAEVSK